MLQDHPKRRNEVEEDETLKETEETRKEIRIKNLGLVIRPCIITLQTGASRPSRSPRDRCILTRQVETGKNI